MISRDFEQGGFPICKRAPVLCWSGEGRVFVAYNRLTLRTILNGIEGIQKVVGVWPGKTNTDIFVMNIKDYKDIPYPDNPDDADIDSAEEITVYYDSDGYFLHLVYRFSGETYDHKSTEERLHEYVIHAGLKHKSITAKASP